MKAICINPPDTRTKHFGIYYINRIPQYNHPKGLYTVRDMHGNFKMALLKKEIKDHFVYIKDF